jgi:hypothetical protein
MMVFSALITRAVSNQKNSDIGDRCAPFLFKYLQFVKNSLYVISVQVLAVYIEQFVMKPIKVT